MSVLLSSSVFSSILSSSTRVTLPSAYATSSDGDDGGNSDDDKKKSEDKKKTKTDNDGGDNKKEKTDEESNKKKDEAPKVDEEKKTTQKEEPKCKPSCDDTTNPPDDGIRTAESKEDGGTKKPLTKEITPNGPTTNSPENCDTNANDCVNKGGTGTDGGGPATLNCDGNSNDPNCASTDGGGGSRQTPKVDCKKSPDDPSCSSTTNTTPSPQCDPDKDPKCTPSTPQQLVSNGGGGGNTTQDDDSNTGGPATNTTLQNNKDNKIRKPVFGSPGLSQEEKNERKKHLTPIPLGTCYASKGYCEFSDDGIGYCDGKKFDCYDDVLLEKHCYNNPQTLRSAECNYGIKIPDNCPHGTSRNDYTGQCLPVTSNPPGSPSPSKIRINIIFKNIIEGIQPIGSSTNSNDTTGKLFREFNNRTNVATGVVVTNTAMIKNQFVNGQVEITGHIQNIRPASISTGAAASTIAATNANNNDINIARTIVVIATFYGSANNVIGVQYGAAAPNTLSPGQSGVFHLIVNNVDSIDHVTYLVQWLGVSGRNAVIHPTTGEVNSVASAATTTTTFPGR